MHKFFVWGNLQQRQRGARTFKRRRVMKLMASVLALFISALCLTLTPIASFPGRRSEGGAKNRPNRLFIHSRSLYVQSLDDPRRLATVFRFPIDKPGVAERIHFTLNSTSKRLGPWMRISGTDIYILSVSDMGGGQFSVGMVKFSLNDLVRGPDDYLRPIQIPTTIGGKVDKSERINVDPLKDALFRDVLPFSLKAGAMKPLTFDKDGKLTNPADSFRVWFDLSTPGDGFHYLYILDEEEFSIWKRDLTTFGRRENSISLDENLHKNHRSASNISPFWQKTLAIEGVPAEPFWVANNGNITTITTASGKVYHLQGENLINRAKSFTPLTDALSRAETPADSATVYIDDLDSEEQWAVSLDAEGKVLSRAHHLKGNLLTSEMLPRNLSNAIQQALPLSKRGKTSGQ